MYVALSLQGRAKKRKTGVFRLNCTSVEELLLQSLFLWKKSVIDKVVTHSLAYLSVQKWLVGDVPFYRENLTEAEITPYNTPIFN